MSGMDPNAGLYGAAVDANTDMTRYTPLANNGGVLDGATGQVQGPGFFQQGGMAQMGLGAISTLGGLWNSFQQSKIAKKSLQLQTKAFNTNLKNQTQTYNTELEDRIRTRYATEGRSDQADSYIEKNKL